MKRFWSLIAVTVLCGPVLALISPSSASAATYYISSSQGSNANSGLTPQSPWQTLDRIFLKSYSSLPFAPGDQILLKRGDTWDGQIRLKATGTAAKPIVLGSYGDGPKPVIYGDGETVGWTPVSGFPGVYRASVGAGSIIVKGYQNTTGLASVSATGLNLASATDLNTYLAKFTPGSFGPVMSTDKIWVKTADGNPPVGVKAFRGAVVYIVRPSAYVVVSDLDIRRSSTGIDVEGSTGITIRNNDVQDTLGIGIYLRYDNTGCLVENNTTTRSGNDGLYILTGSGNTLRGNSVSYVTDVVLGISVVGDQAGIGLQESNGNLVEHNRVSYVKNSGVDYYLEQGSVVRGNYLFHLGSGGAYPHGTNLAIYDNVFNVDWQSGQKFGEGINAVNTGTGSVLVYNNVFYNTNDYALMGSSTTGSVIFRNNIVYGGNTQGYLANFGTNVDSDYNCYYSAATPKFRQGTGIYSGISAFRAGTGQETHSIVANPQFAVSPPVQPEDFRVQATSACVDAGADLKAAGLVAAAEQCADYAGTPVPQGQGWDIGAFELAPAAVSLSVTGANGQVKVDGVTEVLPWSGSYTSGATVQLEAIPDAGYQFTGWSGSISGSTNPVSVVVDSDKAVAASFAAIPTIASYPLNLSGSNGQVAVDGVAQSLPWSDSFAEASVVQLEAIPGAGYQFIGWSGSISGLANPTSVLVDSNKVITASFVAIPTVTNYSLSLAGSNGQVAVDGVAQSLPWSGTFAAGATVQLEAIPDAGYQFAGWSGSASGLTNPTSVVVDSDKAVAASFAAIPTVTYYSLNLSGSYGQVKVDGVTQSLPWSGSFAAGTMVQLEAVPAAGYQFSNWAGSVSGTGNPVSVVVDTDKAITASFTAIPTVTYYSLNLSGSHGHVAVNAVSQSLPWSGTFPAGSTVQLQAAPDTGYQFGSWSGDVSSNSPSISLGVNGNENVAANFVATPAIYTLTLDGANGSAKVNGTLHALPWTGAFAAGASVSLKAMADPGYRFAGWTGDVTSTNSSTSLVMTAAKTITANFGIYVSRRTLRLIGSNTKVAVNGRVYRLPWSGSFSLGDTVTLEPIPDSGYRFSGWSGDVAGTSNPRVLTITRDLFVNVRAPESRGFVDVASDFWAWSEIEACRKAGLVTGFADGGYHPTIPVSRAQMAVYMARWLAGGEGNLPAPPPQASFVDVPSAHWAFAYIEYAKEKGIVSGYGNNEYRPEGEIDRAQTAAFVARALAGGDANVVTAPSAPSFQDVSPDFWAYPYIEYLASREHPVVHGYPDGRYHPDDICTRDQLAVTMARALNLPA